MKKRLGAVPFFIREKDRGASEFGGRFAVHSRGDGEVILTPQLRRRAADLTEREAQNLAMAHAERLAARAGLDPVDVTAIAQSSLDQIRVAANRQRTTREWTRRRLSTAIRLAVARGLSEAGLMRTLNASARQSLNELVENEERRLGRRLTREDVLLLAEEIRSGWGFGLVRPSADYHEQMRFVSFPYRTPDGELVALPVDLEGQLERDLVAGVISEGEARRQAWNNFAVSFGVPMAPDRLVSYADAEAARAYLAARGGVTAAARDWLATEVPEDAEDQLGDALFAPFPYASVDECERAARLLVDRERYAEILWASAMDTAVMPADWPYSTATAPPVGIIDESGYRPL